MQFEVMLYWPRSAVPATVMDSQYFANRWNKLHTKVVVENFEYPSKYSLKHKISNYEDDQLIKLEELYSSPYENTFERHISYYCNDKITHTESWSNNRLSHSAHFHDDHRLIECHDYYAVDNDAVDNDAVDNDDGHLQLSAHYWKELTYLDSLVERLGYRLECIKWSQEACYTEASYWTVGPEQHFLQNGQLDIDSCRNHKWLHKQHEQWYEQVYLPSLGVTAPHPLVKRLTTTTTSLITTIASLTSRLADMRDNVARWYFAGRL